MTSDNGYQIGLFTNIDNNPKNGWIIPLQAKISGIHFDSQTKIPELNERLDSFYDKTLNHSSEFSSVIELFIYYLGNGIKLFYDEKTEQAAINFWVTLDAVLSLHSPQKKQSETFKNRVAVLSWDRSKTKFTVQSDLVKNLYLQRNGFIHKGQPIPIEDVLILRDITQKILNVLIIIHNYSFSTPITYENWLDNLDKLIELVSQEDDFSDELLARCGIIRITDKLI